MDRTAEYKGRDLHAEGEWPPGAKPRYGGVVFNEAGEVLLREPAGHFDGYVWSFPKGASLSGEHPAETALREVREETGCDPVLVGHVPGTFTGGVVGSHNYFYVMQQTGSRFDEAVVRRDGETASVRWASYDDARKLISLSTNIGGRKRDLATLDAAYEAHALVREPGTQARPEPDQ